MANITCMAHSVEARDLYIDLLKKSLTFWLWEAADGSIQCHKPTLIERVVGKAKKVVRGDLSPEPRPTVHQLRMEGRDWPVLAHTMIGQKRMDNLQFCVEDVLQNGVPGD